MQKLKQYYAQYDNAKTDGNEYHWGICICGKPFLRNREEHYNHSFRILLHSTIVMMRTLRPCSRG